MENIKKSFSKVRDDINLINQKIRDLENLKHDINYLSQEIFSLKSVKQDILILNQEVSDLKSHITEVNDFLGILYDQLNDLKIIFIEKIASTDKKQISTGNEGVSTHRHKNLDTSTDNYTFKAVKGQNTDISTGNKGVSTDRQTDRQTDISTQNTPKIAEIPKPLIQPPNPQKDNSEISEVLTNLDLIKTDIKNTLSNLTDKELLVFSTIYQLEEEGIDTDYANISKKLNITPGTIRDHVQRLFAKKAPLFKEKIANKRVLLHVKQDFKKIVSLQTLSNFKHNFN